MPHLLRICIARRTSLSVITLAVWLTIGITSALHAEIYRIDAASSEMTIRPGGFNLGTPTNPEGVAITANNYYLLKGGVPWLPVAGEIHYSRYPDALWNEALRKMRAGGVDIAATYCFWIHHEEIEGEFDFSGRRNLRKFVEACRDAGMQLILRIGPWSHGEVKNGGFPDWLQRKELRLRRNDPEYLEYVRTLFEQYAKQVEGLLYKDGGPIIGIQLENEYGGPPAHILELKKIAREAGFDVPLYTVTGWNNVRIPEREVLPVQAGYPDDFWSRGYERNPLNEQYLFMAGVPVNTGVGTDVLPVIEVYGRRTYDPSDYPWLTAELGLGIQWTHRRRPVIDERDAGALMLVKLAGGANCVGYYMYHGGSNPNGKLTHLAEQGFNRCPLVSYDFQAAVGEFGEIAPKYHVLKLVHYWLQDFGHELAPMIPSMPDVRPTGPADTETFRTMVRSDGRSGYLFFNNYQRYAENQDLEDSQVEVKLGNGIVAVPHTPITIPRDTFGVWPINLNLGGITLRYATAQLFSRFEREDGDYYFFFAHDGITSEFSFAGESLAKLDAGANPVNTSAGMTRVLVEETGLDAAIRFQSADGKPIHVVVLSRDQALHATRHDLWGRRRLIVTDGADTLSDGDTLEVLSTGKPEGAVWVFPPVRELTNNGQTIVGERHGLFQRYQWRLDASNVTIDVSKRDAEDVSEYEVAIPQNALHGVHDVYLDFDQVSDYLTVRLNGRLIGDWYYLGPHYRPSLRHWGDQVLGETLTVALTPLAVNATVFVEARYRPDSNEQDSYAELSKVEAVPVYRPTFTAE